MSHDKPTISQHKPSYHLQQAYDVWQRLQQRQAQLAKLLHEHNVAQRKLERISTTRAQLSSELAEFGNACPACGRLLG